MLSTWSSYWLTLRTASMLPVCLASMAYYVFWGIIGACMSFMGLLIRVIKNAFERAKELKEEVDYTI